MCPQAGDQGGEDRDYIRNRGGKWGVLQNRGYS